MIFRQLKSNLIDILGAAELGRYRTIGYQRQVKAASEALDNSRLVQVYYSSGEFPRSAGRSYGSVQHDITFNVDLTVSRAAEGDLSVITNPMSSQAQIAAALIAFNEASGLADESLDELADIIFSVLMDARNIDYGLPVGSVSNRWIDRISKDNPEPRGEYVILTGSLRLTCRAVENIAGDTGSGGDKIFDFDINLPDDDVQKTGVIIEAEGGV